MVLRRVLIWLVATTALWSLAVFVCTSAVAADRLRVALLPVVDALPMYVAEQERLFDKHRVGVEFVPVASAPERDQLIAANRADGMINEALSTALLNRDRARAQIVRYARAATPQAALFSIVASGASEIHSPQGLRGVEIGISQGTVIDYLTDRLLQAEGLSQRDIRTVAVPRIADRLSLLGTGGLKAAMLPEPATALAVRQGARVILDDRTRPEYSFSTITFRTASIDRSPRAVRGFLAAIEDATALINADPARYAPLLVEYKVVPPALAGSFAVPRFVLAGVPTQAQWSDMLAWAKERGLLRRDVPYAVSVNPGLLP